MGKRIRVQLWGIGLLTVLTMAACSSNDQIVKSPDGDVAVHFELSDNQRPHYRVTYKTQQVLDPSLMGVMRNDLDFSKELTLESVTGPEKVSDSYTMLFGKNRDRTYKANRKVFHLRHSEGEKIDVIFQVSNDGIAFKYRFPENEGRTYTIKEEKTSYHFPEDARAWLQPLANVNTGFAETNPSYEEYYHQNIAVGTPSPNEAGWAYPALFKSGRAWLLISEAGMDGTYAGTRLQPEAPNGVYQIGFPMEGEVFPGGELKPQSSLPWDTPWRLITIGSLDTIVETTLATDVADPVALQDTSWIEPGRASWSWAKLKDPSVNYSTQKEFIDYAADMGWEYTLVDVAWDSTIGYDRMADLADYADSKDVGLMLWYNSSGSWNETVFTPKSELLTHEDRVEEFKRLEEMGIKGIKVDFFNGDGQSMMQYYLDIFKDAAEYNLLVNTHGTTIPRGWHRTWPNLMTMESIRGFEFITFEQANADSAATHSAMIPFTRNVFGPMDFTPMSLTELNQVNRKTTSAFELATPILFTSGIQHYAETADGMQEVPGYVKAFVKQIPVAWDETEFVAGYPGKEVVLARRKGDRWFVAGINGEKSSKEWTLDLSFIPEGASGTLISDGDSRFSYERREVELEVPRELKVSLKGNGGFALILE